MNKAIDKALSESLDTLRSNPDFNPRREKELNDLYDRYIPPHSKRETDYLLDAAERDAYIDPFPPIGSNKLAGKIVKKGVRVAIGWYIQYVSQQISTFGSGVAQALRSLYREVDEIKKEVNLGDVSEYLNLLDLEYLSEDETVRLIEILGTEQKDRIMISQGIHPSKVERIDCFNHVVVVDPRIDYVSDYSPVIDTRIGEFLPQLQGCQDNCIDAIILHGRTFVMPVNQRIAVIRECKRVLKPGSKLIVVFPKQLTNDTKIASELTSSSLWSAETLKHVLAGLFKNIEEKSLNFKKSDVIVAYGDSESS